MLLQGKKCITWDFICTPQRLGSFACTSSKSEWIIFIANIYFHILHIELQKAVPLPVSRTNEQNKEHSFFYDLFLNFIRASVIFQFLDYLFLHSHHKTLRSKAIATKRYCDTRIGRVHIPSIPFFSLTSLTFEPFLHYTSKFSRDKWPGWKMWLGQADDCFKEAKMYPTYNA